MYYSGMIKLVEVLKVWRGGSAILTGSNQFNA